MTRRHRLALVLGLALLAAPTPGRPHAGPVVSTPPPGTGLPQAPGGVVLRFSEPLNHRHRWSRIEVADATGRSVAVGPTMPVDGDPRAMQRKLGLLAPGQYTVRWTTASALDGHTMRGSYAFGIAAAALPGEQIDNDALSAEGWPGLVGRFAAVAGLALWAGFAVLEPVAIRAGVPDGRVLALGRLGPLLILAGTALSLASAAVTGSGSLDALGDLLGASRPGRLRAALIGLGAIGTLVGPRRRGLTRVLAGLALVAEAASGHAAAAGVWVFAIVAATLASDRLVGALAAFSPFAIGAVVVVGVSGLANTALGLGSPADLWSTAYGRAALGKALAFLAMAGLGLVHRRRRRRHSAHAAAVARPLRLELATAVLALALATVLVATPNPPREAGAARPLLRIDPALARIGEREALSVARASGPFVVGLTLLPPTPGSVEVRLQVLGLEAGDGPRDARVQGTSDRGGAFATRLEPCEAGFGCFAGRARLDGLGAWRIEAMLTSNRGTIEIGATLALPAADGATELARAIDAMERLRSAELRETLRAAVGDPLSGLGYRFRAPDAFELQVSGRRQIVIGPRSFDRASPSSPWTASPWPGPPFTWPRNYYREFWREAVAVRLVGTDTVDGIPSRVVAFVRPELPAWFRLWVGVADGLVRRQEMVAEGHLMDHAYSRFDQPLTLGPPV